MIEVSNLTRYYGDFPAIENISFSVKKGEVIGLLGLNGAGKSTTLKVLAGVLAPSSGSVQIGGVDVAHAPPSFRSTIGFLPEEPPQYRDMSVRDFLSYVGALQGMSPARIAERLPQVIEIAQLQGREDQIIETLSFGFRKRVGIAQTIIHNPQLIILDEPAAGLDPAQIALARNIIRNLGQEGAVLISSHILSEISQTCDRILVLHQGRLIAEGTEEQLAQRAMTADRLLITVRGDASAFEAFLQGHAGVKSAQAQECNAPFTAARVELEGDTREALIVDLIGAGFGLRTIEAPQDELEEIFLGLTQQQQEATS
jgi:ABC-2 type transport system ATP-binding protein